MQIALLYNATVNICIPLYRLRLGLNMLDVPWAEKRK